MRLLFLTLIPALLLSACGPKQSTKAPAQFNPDGIHEVTVKEVIQGATYTYALVSESGSEYWLATAKSEIEQGGKYYYSNGTEMKQFQSKELERTFESIIFVEALSSQATAQSPHGGDMPSGHGMGSSTSGAPGMERADIQVEKVSGGITIAELYGNLDKYKGKQVKVSGQVMKVNNDIMGTNWVHIQDGTEHNEQFDLTVTTEENFQLGEKAIFEGKIAVEKDFGYGYKYPVIMEEGKRILAKKL